MYRAGGQRQFERMVAEALDALPDELARHMSNVDVVIEDFPHSDELEWLDDEEAGSLLGLYQGIPLTERTDYAGVLPDRIVLYRRNIEEAARSHRHLVDLVRTTVIHEVAHHFGIDDERLQELGWD